jgi:hypothetical protein
MPPRDRCAAVLQSLPPNALELALTPCSVRVHVSRAGAAALPGELDDTRFLKGLRLGPADKEAVTQYVEMGLWRRIGWLNQLAHTAAEDANLGASTSDSQSSAEGAAADDSSSSMNFKQWYTEEYTTMLGDELDALRQQAGFSARDVSALIGCIDGSATVLSALDMQLATSRIVAK